MCLNLSINRSTLLYFKGLLGEGFPLTQFPEGAGGGQRSVEEGTGIPPQKENEERSDEFSCFLGAVGNNI